MNSPGEIAERPSKSQRKRDMHRLQELGARLVKLTARELDALHLTEEVAAAVVDARGMTRSAYQRQIRYIGKLLSRLDGEALQHAVDAQERPARDETERFHALETWRERLLEEGEQAVAELTAVYPAVDARKLGRLLDDVARERSAGAPPKAYRLLFRYLRGLAESGQEGG